MSGRGRAVAGRTGAARTAYADQRYAAYDTLVEDHPDLDLPEVPSDLIDLYRWGSRPRCEEQEYTDTVQELIGRLDG
ncbi:hypothetical protein ACFV3R_07220 [Streptomyces sp. NPDC059740]|uniref:hypothetical protein n=1 Tax=Streptomyces sp. NPDC059740 TaxID=3346926 RepID=UPI0036675EE6